MIVTLTPQHSSRFAGDTLPENCQGPALQYLMTARVASWSMYPALCKGDRLELQSAALIQVGDLVVFRTPFGLVCHRVVHRKDELLHTKGDATSGPPEPVRTQDVLGLVAAVTRGSTRVPVSDLATLSPSPSWTRHLDRITRSLLDRSRRITHDVIRRLLQHPWSGTIIAHGIARYASVEQREGSPIGLFHDAIAPGLSAPPSGRPDYGTGPPILLIRLGSIYLGIFHPGTHRLELRPILAGTGVETALVHRLSSAQAT